MTAVLIDRVDVGEWPDGSLIEQNTAFTSKKDAKQDAGDSDDNRWYRFVGQVKERKPSTVRSKVEENDPTGIDSTVKSAWMDGPVGGWMDEME